MRVDHESGVSSDAFRKLGQQKGIRLQFSGVESHNSIDSKEGYHQTLCRLFSVVRQAHLQLHPEVAQRMALNGINDAMGPRGLVPNLLVFGVLPTVPITATDRPSQKEVLQAL